MRPFNLKEALAGKPVVTRDGRAVTELHQFKGISDNRKFHIVGVLDGCITTYTLTGRHSTSGLESHCDLFMAPTKAYYTMWRLHGETAPAIGCCYDSREEAESTAALGTTAIFLGVFECDKDW